MGSLSSAISTLSSVHAFLNTLPILSTSTAIYSTVLCRHKITANSRPSSYSTDACLQWLCMGCPPPVDLSSSQQPQHVMRVLQWCAVLSRPSILLDSLSCRREQLRNQFVGRAVRWQHPCPSSRFRTIDRRATGLDRA